MVTKRKPKEVIAAKITAQEIERIAKMQLFYDCIEAHPGFNSVQISEVLGISRAAARMWLRMLVDCAYVNRLVGQRGFQGCDPDSFTITEKGRPAVAPPRKTTVKVEVETSIKRKFCKAVQIGVARDAMIAAFFGPVVA